MTLPDLVSKLAAVQSRAKTLRDERRKIKTRDTELSRALARFQLIEYDLLKQIRAIATEDEIAICVSAHIEKPGQWVYVPRPSAWDAEFERDAAKRIESTKALRKNTRLEFSRREA